MYPETKKGKSQAAGANKAQGRVVADKVSATFTEDTAAKTGQSARQVRRDVAIAANIPGDLHEAIADSPIADNKSELAKLGKLDESVQRDVVDLLASGDAESVDDATVDVCLNCGHDEFDDDGDCEKCHEPTREQHDATTIGPLINSIRNIVSKFIGENPEFVTPIVDALRDIANETENA